MAKKNIKAEISVPSKSANIKILNEIIESKADLIKHALGIESVSIKNDNKKITFPWFTFETGSDEAIAYMLLVTKLCDLSKTITRVNKTDNDYPNEKYAFRCFLLRLGFIGNEYKVARKILLKNLSGSSAFKKQGGDNE